MLRLALFGQPVAQSLSPWIHGELGRQAGLEIRYEAIDTEPGTLAKALESFAASGGTGCNVTLPLKHEAMALALQCSAAVRLAGAANTLLLDSGGWVAESTDGPGLITDLRDAGMDPAGQRIAILGAGGATASILGAVLTTGPEQVTLFNRTLERAESLAAQHRHLGKVTAQPLHALAGAGTFGLVLNATSMGHQAGRPALHQRLFAADGQCYDLNYGGAAAPLQQWCQETGIPYRDGLGMLVAQAAESFRLWTGFSADLKAVLSPLQQHLRKHP